MVDGHQLGAVGKGGLDLDRLDHLGHAGHALPGRDHMRACLHQIGDAAPVAGAFDDEIGDQAMASGWFSRTPRDSRLRATIAASETSSFSRSRGVRFILDLPDAGKGDRGAGRAKDG